MSRYGIITINYNYHQKASMLHIKIIRPAGSLAGAESVKSVSKYCAGLYELVTSPPLSLRSSNKTLCSSVCRRRWCRTARKRGPPGEISIKMFLEMSVVVLLTWSSVRFLQTSWNSCFVTNPKIPVVGLNELTVVKFLPPTVSILVHALEDLLNVRLLAEKFFKTQSLVKIPVHVIEELLHLLPVNTTTTQMGLEQT